jgi:transcriptional regulator with XRE-family HTH domain
MFAEKLAAELVRHGYSQRHFAQLIGVDPSTITGWMKGRCQPKAATFSRVVRVLPRMRNAFDPQ